MPTAPNRTDEAAQRRVIQRQHAPRRQKPVSVPRLLFLVFCAVFLVAVYKFIRG